MRFLILLVLSLSIALGLGAWTAQLALDRSASLGTVEVGSWIANPLAGSLEADPYSKARLARIGNLTLGIGEGVVFRAMRDGAGRPLRRDCLYRLAGQTPPARIFTLAAFTPAGRLIQAGDGRPGWLVSRGLMRAEDNRFEIAVGPKASAGNWLALTGAGEYVLTLTLYDTPASSSSGLGDLEMPTLERVECGNG